MTEQNEIERRVVPLGEIRLVGDDQGQTPRISGHAAVFGSLSESLFGFREVIEPGFFREALGDDVRALWNHNADLVLGRTKSGTLRIAEDETGLAIEADPPATTWAHDALVTMGRGDVDQMSFAFEVRRDPPGDDWRRDEAGQLVRYLLPGGCARLYDVSPVTFPAYTQTDVSVRALDTARALNDSQEADPPPPEAGGDGSASDEAGAEVRHDLKRKRLDLLAL